MAHAQNRSTFTPEAFNPYTEWLGIPVEEQPPNYYRLLGVALFEQNLQLIHDSADYRMRAVHSQVNSPYGAYVQPMIDLIRQAHTCLLNPQYRAAYDWCVLMYKNSFCDRSPKSGVSKKILARGD
jgi:hypothetical protein